MYLKIFVKDANIFLKINIANMYEVACHALDRVIARPIDVRRANLREFYMDKSSILSTTNGARCLRMFCHRKVRLSGAYITNTSVVAGEFVD